MLRFVVPVIWALMKRETIVKTIKKGEFYPALSVFTTE